MSPTIIAFERRRDWLDRSRPPVASDSVQAGAPPLPLSVNRRWPAHYDSRRNGCSNRESCSPSQHEQSIPTQGDRRPWRWESANPRLPPMRDINLRATACFEAVARLGTVTKAAAELGVSPSAISQQIRVLESQFGVSLFRRDRKRLVLTLDGDRLFQTTTQAFGAIRNARSAITRKRNVPKPDDIRVSPSFGVRWLGPRIAAFAAENPEWNIRIDATPDFTSFETEAVDLDLRYGLGGWAGAYRQLHHA